MADHDYESGLRDGKIEALKDMIRKHDTVLDHHDKRFQYIERILYILIGLWGITEVVPRLPGIFGP